MQFIKKYYGFLVVVILLATGCSFKNSSKERDNPIGNGHRMTEYSDLMAIYDNEDYDEVFIVNGKGEDVAHYILIDKNNELPPTLPEDAIILRTPLTSIIVDSEVYGGVLEELGKLNVIKGVFDQNYVTLASLKSLIDKGEVKGFGPTSSPNIEKILELQPEGIVLSYFEGMKTADLEKTGVPIIKMYDLQETSPLGRAEWIKFLGLLIGQELQADSIFNETTKRYNDIKAKIENSRSEKKILLDLPYNGVWYTAGGNSYQSVLIKDAGGLYPWSSSTSASTLNLSIEQVLEKAHDADIWIIKSFGEDLTIEKLLEKDKRFREFLPVKTGNIYFSNTSGSQLFIEFPFHPDLLLEEYEIIFSGDQTRPLRYFKKI